MEKNCLQKLLEEGYTDADAFYKCGLELYQNGNLEQAILAWDQVIDIEQENADAFICRGKAKLELGRYEEAIEDCTQALVIEPENIDAFNIRGSVKYELGRYEEAIEDCNLTLVIDPKNATAFHNRSAAKFNLHRYKEAVKDLDSAINVNSKYADAFFVRGAAKSELGYIQEATLDYYRAVFLFGKKLPGNNISKTLRHFHDTYPAPFQVKNLLNAHPEIYTQLTFNTLLTENARQCRPMNTWLLWLDVKYPTPHKEADWLRAWIHYHMGDPITAFQILDQLKDGGQINFAQQYFFLRAADDILHDERDAIRKSACRAALKFSKNNDEDDGQVYWAARLLTYCDEPLAALDCLKKGLPGELYFYLNRSEAYEAAGLSGGRSIDLAKETIPCTGIEPEEVLRERNLKPGDRLKDWLWEMEMTAQFYDLEALINREFGAGKIYARFWEIRGGAELETALIEHRKAELEARLQAVFAKNISEHYAGQSPDEERFKQKGHKVWRTFSDLKKSEDLVYEISAMIFEAQLPREILADLLEYFYLSGQLPADEILYLYFYLSVCKKCNVPPEAFREGTQEAGKVWLENLLKNVLEKGLVPGLVSLGMYGEAITAGLALGFTSLARQFLEKSFDSTNKPYPAFKKDFREFIFEKVDLLGEPDFLKEFPLAGFDDFNKTR